MVSTPPPPEFECTIDPMFVSVGEPVEITISGEWHCLPFSAYPSVWIDYGVVMVSLFEEGPCLNPVIAPFSETVTVVPLEPGLYDDITLEIVRYHGIPYLPRYELSCWFDVDYRPWTPPCLDQAFSRRSHQQAGDFGIPMALHGSTSQRVECRLGGVRQIELAFNSYLWATDGMLDATEFLLSHGQVDAVSQDGAVLTIDVSGVPDACCLTLQAVGLEDAWGSQITGLDGHASIGVLEGDTNNDENTDVIDLGQVATLSGSTVDEDLARVDVNLDGYIDIIDLGAVATLSGSSADCGP
jgi:hypothetical protein